MTSGATRVTSRPPFLALALAVLGTALFAALNVWTRVHDQPDLSSPGTIWEPITWELSSAIATLALIPLVWRGVLAAEKPAERRYTTVVPIMSYALAFYVLHVTTFVLLRWCTYAALGRTYVFGGAMSWFYELPKDVVSFAILFAILMAGRRLGERPHEGKASLHPCRTHSRLRMGTGPFSLCRMTSSRQARPATTSSITVSMAAGRFRGAGLPKRRSFLDLTVFCGHIAHGW